MRRLIVAQPTRKPDCFGVLTDITSRNPSQLVFKKLLANLPLYTDLKYTDANILAGMIGSTCFLRCTNTL